MATLRTSVSSDKENDYGVVDAQYIKLSETDDENHQTECNVD